MNERLQQEFGDRLRIRWSQQEQNWTIEQKFTRGYHPSRQQIKDSESDEMIRARDGYLQICSVQPGDRMRCTKCNDTLSVPVNEFRMIQCMNCKRLGYESKYVIGFFDLAGDHLIEHLRRLDPLKGASNELRKKIAEDNKKRWEQEQNKSSKLAEEYVTQEMSKDLFGIAHVGRTGREASWEDAPETDYARNIQKEKD